MTSSASVLLALTRLPDQHEDPRTSADREMAGREDLHVPQH